MRTFRAVLRSWPIVLALIALPIAARADDDVVVQGRKKDPGASSLSGDDVRAMPGAFGDPARAVENLPGVIPTIRALPFFFVRGATPSGTVYFVDGMRVPVLSHAPPGAAVIASSLVDKVDFYPGAAPVRYAGATGSIVTLTERPPENRFRADVDVKAYDASALVESPFAEAGSAMMSGRYGYTQPILRLFEPTAQQTYWDYHGRVTWDLPHHERLSVVALGARDYTASDDTGILFDASFHRVELRWDTPHTRVAATFGFDIHGNDVGEVDTRSLALRVDSSHPIGSQFEVGVGAQARWESYKTIVARAGEIDPETLFAPRNDLTIGGYTELVWHASRNVDVTPGVRVDLYTTKRDEYPRRYVRATELLPPPGVAARVGVDPRLSVRARVTQHLTFVSAIGVAHAPPSFFLPGLVTSRLEDGLQTAIQSSAGIEAPLPDAFSIKAGPFLHDYIDINDPSATCPITHDFFFNPTNACYGRRVRGQSFGGELLVRRALSEKLGGLVSYTLSRSTRESHPRGWAILGASTEQIPNVKSEYDRTHVLALIADWTIGKGFRAGARFSYGTGVPYSHTVHGALVGPYDVDRLPDIYRVDLRLEKRWTFGESRFVAIVLEGFNVTGATDPTECRPRTQIFTSPVPEAIVRNAPIDACKIIRTPAFTIPSVGVSASY